MSKQPPIDYAFGLRAKLNGKSSRAIAKQLKRSHSSVAQSLALLKLTASVQEMLKQGLITKTHARALMPLAPKQQLQFAKLAISKKLSVRELEREIKGTQPKNVSADTVRLERKISEQLGTSVTIDEKLRHLIIQYHDLEILSGILNKIGCGSEDEL